MFHRRGACQKFRSNSWIDHSFQIDSGLPYKSLNTLSLFDAGNPLLRLLVKFPREYPPLRALSACAQLLELIWRHHRNLDY